jgi:hypothetical protein
MEVLQDGMATYPSTQAEHRCSRLVDIETLQAAGVTRCCYSLEKRNGLGLFRRVGI